MLTGRFAEAFQYACGAHAGQTRKGTHVPYISHLMEVAAIVLMHGGTEDEAIGALLHDAAEDAGGRERLRDIRQRFGASVAEIVEGLSDTLDDPKPEWLPRKHAFIARIGQPATSRSVLLVSAADKLSNARSLLDDYRQAGESLWGRFRGGREGTLWYYAALADVLSERLPGTLSAELHRVVTELRRLTDHRSTN